MKKLERLALCIVLLSTLSVGASSLVSVSKGRLEAIWLSPMSVKIKNQTKTTRSFIQVKDFKLMAKAVTVKQFKEFLEKNSDWRKDKVSSLFTDANYLHGFENARENSPVTNVSWFAARTYCKSQGLRLPTLNEWEYAAAASETLRDANKNELFLKRILEWYGEPQTEQIKEVGSIYKNLYGAYDMHGLIWEWVEDFNTTFVTGESREDSSFNKDMFCGAGSLASNDKENYAAFMRFAFRSSLKGKSSIWNLGFRCAQ
ncbi:formylglycine-generating enzyme family protein [Pseudobdellovibrio sp. HCB154]|uniref:formylglycine-generating enzyme family protein n=1 Tax=Pseudobdellovibrio sp. HCB154 TaxID=3386277 RepID=UPI003916F386